MKPARPFVIDDMASMHRKPSAAPIITPAEIIALALNGTMWIPGKGLVKDDDVVVQQIISLLDQAGWKITEK